MGKPTFSLRAVKRTVQLGVEADGPNSFSAAVLVLVEAVEAAGAFTRTPADWMDASVQEAYGKLRAALARFTEEAA